MSHVLADLPVAAQLNIGCEMYEFKRVRELEDRRLYLYGEIAAFDEDERGLYYDVAPISRLAEIILDFNRRDDGIPPEEREPIRLYINSPGGDVAEGFALISAMELSKTPIYTINIGEWMSMAFLIGIVGRKRFSLPHSIFMMHEPSGLAIGKFSDMEDRVNFNRRFNNDHIRALVMRNSQMSEKEYSEVSKKDYYMLPEDALKHGFIDEIVTDIDSIL